MPVLRYPSLFQINTRVRLAELTNVLGRPATLDDISDEESDRLAGEGLDLVWFLGVWQTGEAARRVSASNPVWWEEYQRVLPDFQETDISGSCFAVRDYHVHKDFGGDEALARLRERLCERGLRLILDFVPNHLAPDHPWVDDHPDFFVQASEEKLAGQPQNYRRMDTSRGSRVLAYGRDPYFDGWPDTLQLNYGNPMLQEALLAELQRIASQCDGVRCDMAMLVLPEIFERTWGIRADPFWPRVTETVRTDQPNFLFLAEVYWGLEWTLQQQGFDYTYDKRLYDRLVQGNARTVREHLCAGLDFQDHLARFGGRRAPRCSMVTADVHRAARDHTYTRSAFHQGQRKVSVRIPDALDGTVRRTGCINQRVHDSPCLPERPCVHDGQWPSQHQLPGRNGAGCIIVFHGAGG
jgi:hypothetical protein